MAIEPVSRNRRGESIDNRPRAAHTMAPTSGKLFGVTFHSTVAERGQRFHLVAHFCPPISIGRRGSANRSNIRENDNRPRWAAVRIVIKVRRRLVIPPLLTSSTPGRGPIMAELSKRSMGKRDPPVSLSGAIALSLTLPTYERQLFGRKGKSSVRRRCNPFTFCEHD